MSHILAPLKPGGHQDRDNNPSEPKCPGDTVEEMVAVAGYWGDAKQVGVPNKGGGPPVVLGHTRADMCREVLQLRHGSAQLSLVVI